eukprot:scaffold2280_cov430-Prasinococcus_capsulatus_cf.AAC.23
MIPQTWPPRFSGSSGRHRALPERRQAPWSHVHRLGGYALLEAMAHHIDDVNLRPIGKVSLDKGPAANPCRERCIHIPSIGLRRPSVRSMVAPFAYIICHTFGRSPTAEHMSAGAPSPPWIPT